ncbi:hypothetical protein FV223_29340 [Methylobacterium sp. WL116]|nr:hypothetical protein FV223_29340 [Methylobacterium sp. WL116]
MPASRPLLTPPLAPPLSSLLPPPIVSEALRMPPLPWPPRASWPRRRSALRSDPRSAPVSRSPALRRSALRKLRSSRVSVRVERVRTSVRSCPRKPTSTLLPRRSVVVTLRRRYSGDPYSTRCPRMVT